MAPAGRIASVAASACRHPVGAVALLESVLTGFPAHVEANAEGVPSAGLVGRAFPAPPGFVRL